MSSKQQNIKKFIKKELQCACPDEVFEYIDFERVHLIDKDFPSITRINIGHRLLVYIYIVKNLDILNIHINKLFNFGNEEKRTKNFNRFRLVLASNNTKETERCINISNEEYISNSNSQNIHLHILHKDTLANLLD